MRYDITTNKAPEIKILKKAQIVSFFHLKNIKIHAKTAFFDEETCVCSKNG